MSELDPEMYPGTLSESIILNLLGELGIRITNGEGK